MALDIGSLADRDLSAAHALSAAAGWGFRERDWRRLLAMPSVTALAGRLDGDLVATATVIRYEPPATADADRSASVAWIGSMLVAESHRRRGHGTEMFEAALSRATEQAAIVGLDANAMGKPIYEAAGLVAVAPADQWRGTLAVAGSPDAVAEATDTDAVAEFDARACGVDRSGLLRRLFRDPETHAFVHRDAGTITGYGVVRPVEHGWTVGPIVADGPETVGHLLAAIGSVTDDDPVTLSTAGESRADRQYLAAGLERVRTLDRMTYDRPATPLLGPRIRAIPGFAFG